MEKHYLFPKKCCVCLADCNTTRELTDSISAKDGFHTKITSFTCSVPVCEKCQSKFGRIGYGWLTWFAFVAFGAILGTMTCSGPENNIGNGAFLGAAGWGIIGLFPSFYIALNYGHKTEAPAFLSKMDGKPCFLNKEYQKLFDELNQH